jgi:hypothetical protein
MHRTVALVAILATASLVTLGIAMPAGATSAGGCQLQGTASLSPGLTNTAQNFAYRFSGALSGCRSSDSTAPTGGSVSAGQVETVSGEQFQEPVPTGNGSCANGTTAGTAIITWSDGTQTVISYTTSAAGAAVDLSGDIVPSVTLPAINPQPGQPTSRQVNTTRYAGGQAKGLLAFEADATQCAGAGVSSAGIAGVVTVSTP